VGIGIERVREKIKHEVARILQNEMNDPRMGFVTVVGCELSADYRHCKIHVSFLEDRPGEIRRILGMLEDARGYVQGKLAGRLRTRVTPRLEFIHDTGAQKSIAISSLLDDLRREREEREAAHAPPSEDGEPPDEPPAEAE